jgi:hypothetical protein
MAYLIAPIYAAEDRQQLFDTTAEMIFGHQFMKVTNLMRKYQNDGTSKLCLESVQSCMVAPGIAGLLFKTESRGRRDIRGGRVCGVWRVPSVDLRLAFGASMLMSSRPCMSCATDHNLPLSLPPFLTLPFCLFSSRPALEALDDNNG